MVIIMMVVVVYIYVYMNIALRRFLHNHGNIATQGSKLEAVTMPYSFFE